ncbi:hypothetical protein DACRYDRAFT_17675 [Dacryopinax primogenitus]|uniref:Uncharacterized protein n=1 Tax=Dacryopinax primogenitus (strain DJM 731) TaxID=1858805 RepID=M5FZK0_DACPD|nr:uncharacterized protein DACRYDRAFT_17675 [Dacryopinax primogenitus]EJT98991.1 hypothetical protein DACRYDRAFT_17675 [Dacryopinax primogenitus]
MPQAQEVVLSISQVDKDSHTLLLQVHKEGYEDKDEHEEDNAEEDNDLEVYPGVHLFTRTRVNGKDGGQSSCHGSPQNYPAVHPPLPTSDMDTTGRKLKKKKKPSKMMSSEQDEYSCLQQMRIMEEGTKNTELFLNVCSTFGNFCNGCSDSVIGICIVIASKSHLGESMMIPLGAPPVVNITGGVSLLH